MHLIQALTTLITLFTPALCLPPFILRSGFPSPSLYPTEYDPSTGTDPASLLIKRQTQTCASTCGTVCYFQRTVDAAVSEGFELFQAGKTEGSGDYPHTFRNDEEIELSVPGPYQEFPILNDFQEYDGGSPGPDRVIFNEDGELAGVITHTGSQVRNGFVTCT
ncbi:hypothetical protein LTR84_002832 [Exophiala bonariae]|uniref:ribonuclease T1 n=1 Tax=Exophiala bonariae TaxID=1690606 RepID=A0AAV9NCH1_9EURO|nr:hypothetical protein LTR84_002832 [Exophiala bonariae]